MPGWAWLCVGVALLVLEVTVQTEFWLAVIGLAAIGVGVNTALGLGGPVWLQWAQLAGLSIALAVFVRRRLHEKFVGRAPGVAPDLVGDLAVAEERIAPGHTGAVGLRGTIWRAHNVGERPVKAGSDVRVLAVRGLDLEVRA